VPVHVGLNLLYLVPGETGGMETYARELVPALLEEEPGLKLTAFVNREAADALGSAWGERVEVVVVPVWARRRVEWVRGEQQLLPPRAKRAGVDLVHSLAGTGPAWGAFVRVVTINDLIYKIYPEAHAGLRSLGMRVLVPLAARRSQRVIAPSQWTRDDLVRLLGVPPGKIDVVPDGLGTSARAVPVAEDVLRGRYDLGDRTVVLTVSAKRPHKNLERLLEAVAAIPPEERPLLVLPGYATPFEHALERKARELGLDDDARFLGWVPDDELEGLYALARCFVFPSLYEGFGLPILEAMSRGVPVVCSDRSSLPEVAGSAARFFDPEEPRAIAEAIRAVLGDPAEADRLRVAGRAQAARFDWRETARGTIASYERALAAP
jgi:glycosyltransferase involved in cell wall biosynthesis